MRNDSNNATDGAVYYRLEDVAYAAPLDEYDTPCGPSTVDVHLRTFEVIRYTPKGVWIRTLGGDKRFVRSTARKRYACATIDTAYESFLARKHAQARIYTARLRQTDTAIKVAHKKFAQYSKQPFAQHSDQSDAVLDDEVF